MLITIKKDSVIGYTKSIKDLLYTSTNSVDIYAPIYPHSSTNQLVTFFITITLSDY